MEDDVLLTDLIPKRLGTYWILFFLGGGGIVLLEFCHFKISVIKETLNLEQIPALDLGHQGSLASWFTSLFWITAAFFSILVYFIRNSEIDTRRMSDIWVWGAMACIYLSMDQVARIRDLFRDIMIHYTGTPLYGSGSVWWLAGYILIFGMIGTRILAEIRHYLPACNALLMSGICFIVAFCAELGVFASNSIPDLGVMVRAGAEMSGGLFLVLAIGLYGRHLIMPEPAVYKTWRNSLWRHLSRRVIPTRYNYNDTGDYEESDDYQRARRRHAKSRGEHWNDESWNNDEQILTEQAAARRRGHRLKKNKKGIFY
ncbi:MAG: hypothetical protein FWC50_13810 [Planctomycetaceae bacterium]|nr:hypothetical protein [Planctomycetaceae bacterium]